jgi:hypothetical protein
MKKPSGIAMSVVRDESDAADELDFFNIQLGERTALTAGDRVYLVTVDGEFPGTVIADWSPEIDEPGHVMVDLDCNPKESLTLNRAVFRAFTALDHIASL